MKLIEQVSFGVLLAAAATPAFAGSVNPSPAPVVGIGVGAILLVGVGYRALKSRIDR